MQTMWTSIPVEPALLLPVLTTLLRFGTSDPIRCYNTTKVKKCNLHHSKAHFYLKLFVLASVRSRPVDLEWAARMPVVMLVAQSCSPVYSQFGEA